MAPTEALKPLLKILSKSGLVTFNWLYVPFTYDWDMSWLSVFITLHPEHIQ